MSPFFWDVGLDHWVIGAWHFQTA